MAVFLFLGMLLYQEDNTIGEEVQFGLHVH